MPGGRNEGKVAWQGRERRPSVRDAIKREKGMEVGGEAPAWLAA